MPASPMPPPPRDRISGLVYLVVVLSGLFGLLYVPSRMSLAGSVHEVAARVVAHEGLFRWGIASLLVNQVAFLLLPLALLRVFHRVSLPASALMVALSTVSVPVALVGVGHRLDALRWLTDAAYRTGPGPDARALAAFEALQAARHSMLLSVLFWGLWLLPLAYLVLKSKALPAFLGVFLALGGLGYAVQAFGQVLVPGFSDLPWTSFVALPATVGEIGTCLWLLLRGVPVPASPPA